MFALNWGAAEPEAQAASGSTATESTTETPQLEESSQLASPQPRQSGMMLWEKVRGAGESGWLKQLAAENETFKKAQQQLGLQNTWGSKYMIDPRASRYLWMWDLVTALSLGFVALVTPVEVAYLEPAVSWLDPLFLINQVINLIFLLDILLQFFVQIPITDEFGTRYTADARRIALHYLTGWLTIDVLSVAVSAVDYLTIANAGAGGATSAGAPRTASDLDNVRALRVLRALRLIKLSKLITGQRILKRWETKLALNYAAIGLINCLVGMLLLSHIFACIWGLQAAFANDKSDTWLGATGLCVRASGAGSSTSTSSAAGGSSTSDALPVQPQVVCASAFDQYVGAIYWAVMTITSMYGMDEGLDPPQFMDLLDFSSSCQPSLQSPR